jgi:hypothetical protein
MDREKGEAAKLEQSPLAYLIAEQEAEFDLFDQIIRMTETQLGKLEGRHPERLPLAKDLGTNVIPRSS